MSTSRNDNILFSKNKFTKKGSGIQLLLGIIVLTSAIWIELNSGTEILFYVLLVVGIILTASSFLILINQYERVIILRLVNIRNK